MVSSFTPSRSLTRRDQVWQVCDQLASQNDKPSLSKVRGTHKGGSDTDVQADIQAWYASVFQKHSVQAAGLGVPDEVAQIMRTLWSTAMAAASGHLDKERDDLANARETIALEKQAILDQHQALQAQWEDLKLTHQEQSHLLAITEERLQQTQANNAGLVAEQGVLNQRLSSLMQDVSMMEVRHSEMVSQLSQQHSVVLEQVSSEHRSRLMEFETAQTVQEQRHRGMEKHMLLQIEEARVQITEWKTKAEYERGEGQVRHDMLNAQLQQARQAAAHTRGQQESLQTQVTILEAQKEQLFRELVQLQLQPQPHLLPAPEVPVMPVAPVAVVQKPATPPPISPASSKASDPDGYRE